MKAVALLLLSTTLLAQQSQTNGTTMTSGASIGGGSSQGIITLLSVTVGPSSATIATGAVQNYTATGNYSDGSTQDVTTTCVWSSSNTAVATIGPKGNPQSVNGVSAGTATITCNDAGITGTGTLVVSAVVVITNNVPPATVGTAYSVTFTASGGTAPYSFTLTGTLPTGLSFSSPTLSGTPGNGTQGSYPITANVSDSASPPNISSRSYVLVVNSAAGFLGATLPQTWVNNHKCDPANGVYDVTKNIPGDYPATMVGWNQSMSDWAAASDQFWHVIVAAGTAIKGSNSQSSGATALQPILRSKPVGAGLPTKCIVYESSVRSVPTTTTVGTTSPGTSVVVASATNLSKNQAIRIYGAGASGADYYGQITNVSGTTLTISPATQTSVSAGHTLIGYWTQCAHTVGLADSTNRNPGCTNDISNMWSIVGNALGPGGNSKGIVMYTDVSDVNGNGPSHIVIRDAEILTCVGKTPTAIGQCDGTAVATPNQFSMIDIGPTPVSGTAAIADAPTTIGFENDYIHGFYGDTGNDPNQSMIVTALKFGCGDCWAMWNYIDQISCHPTGGTGCESHGIGLSEMTTGVKIRGNFIECCSIPLFTGGGNSPYPAAEGGLGHWFVATDGEIRENDLTHNPAWMPLPCSVNLAVKNSGEMKVGIRFLWNGNKHEWSNGCGQHGQVFNANVRACSGGPTCDNYDATIEDLTVSNEVFAHGANGIENAGRSIGPGAGISTSRPGRRWDFINLLFYDIANNANHPGNVPSDIYRTGVSTGGLSWTCSASRTSNVVTLTCADGGTGQHQTDTAVGDPVIVTTCVDSTYNTPTGQIGPPALSGTNGLNLNGLTVVYASAGANGTTTGCTFRNLPGWPAPSRFLHATAIGQGITMGAPSGNSSKVGPGYTVNQIFRDSLFVIDPVVGWNGWVCCGVGEGNQTETTNWDQNTLADDHLDFVGRGSKAVNYVSYPSGLDGSNSSSTLWFDTAAVCSAATVGGSSSSCPGLAGMMSGAAFKLNSSAPFTDYALVADSPYKSGGARQASDGTDMGVNFTSLSTAETETKYSGCSTNPADTNYCGATGPFSD